MSKHKNKESKKVEVLPDKINDRSLQRREDSKVDVHYKPSRFPWVNKFHEKIMESFTRYVKAEAELMEAGISHSLVKERFKNIHVEIEKERLERLVELKEAQIQVGVLDVNEEIEIYKKEKELEKLELEERVNATKKRIRDSKSASNKNDYERDTDIDDYDIFEDD